MEARIDELERNGPDGVSTLSELVFALDDDDDGGVSANTANTTANATGSPVPEMVGSPRKLSRREIVDNAIFLIAVGFETTLTNAVACLGWNRASWHKLVQEQRSVRSKFGDALTREALEARLDPYLEAVVRETLRIRPISGSLPRVMKETMVVHRQQILKGWILDWSAPLSHELDPKTFRPGGLHMDVLLFS